MQFIINAAVFDTAWCP